MSVKLIKSSLVGELVSNGEHICIASRPIHSDTFIVLAFRAKHPVHKYVVWTSEHDGTCYQGDYFEDLGEAYERYLTR